MGSRLRGNDAEEEKMSPRNQIIAREGLHGFLAQPDAPTTGGVLILSTIFGVNDFVRDYAETLARAGLAAAVWDLYSGAPLPADYKESLARARKLNDSSSVTAMKRWADYMLDELRLDSLGVLGFCLGGRFALIHAAKDKRIKACAAAYPSIENPLLANQSEDALALAPQIGCPVHIMQPGHDHVATPETYATLKASLFKRPVLTSWQYYPEAEHGFMHRPEPAANPAATRIASPQLVAFLTACLG
jgi:carboxymethylenebutenolidase